MRQDLLRMFSKGPVLAHRSWQGICQELRQVLGAQKLILRQQIPAV